MTTDGRSYSHEVLEHYRLRAVELRKEGKKVNDIADFFGVNRVSVSRWISTCKQFGKEKLKSKKASGPKFKLAAEEISTLIGLMCDDAMKHGFETPLWTCKRIQKVMKAKVGKKLHTTNIMRLLRRSGLTPQKPRRRALERDDLAVERWLKEEWPKIREKARRWQAMLYFQDESGVSLTSVLGKTWALKGNTPIAKVTGNRGSFCVTSAISPAGKLVFRIEKGKVNAVKHVEFLEQIMKQHPRRKIIVIEDRSPVHRAKLVQEFVQQHEHRLAVYKLPPYAPELNPDEHVWKYLKAYQLKSHQAKTTDELKSFVKRKMQGIQRKRGLVASFFLGTYVI